MRESLLHRLDFGARHILPFASAALFVLLGVAAWPLPFLGSVAPPMTCIAIYFWAVHRPDLLGPAALFLLGVVNDSVNGLPLGLSALMFVGAYILILQQRRVFVGHSFPLMWGGFALTVFLVMLAGWLLLCVMRWQAVPFGPVLMQILLVSVIFPLPYWLLIRVQRLTMGRG